MGFGDDKVLANAPVMFDAQRIDAAVADVAARIMDRCRGNDPIVISVLLGALPFTAALLPRLQFPLQLDYAQLSRYRGETRGSTLRWLRVPQLALDGRQVVLVDDVLDDGETLAELQRWCVRAGAADVVTAVLVRKRSPRRPPDTQVDIAGLDAPDRYLFGFGMDYQERYRHLPEIRALAKDGDRE